MKIIKILTLFVLIISCADRKSENKISEFDKVLGKENIATLDFLVSDFENDYLKRQYPNLDTENAYRQFLTEIRDRKFKNLKKVSQKANEKFESSDLRLEMYKFPDSAWILLNSSFDKIESDSLRFLESPVPYVKSRHKYINPDGTTEYTYSRNYLEIRPNADFDSIINRELNSAEINYIGKYMRALETIKDKSEFHSEFYEKKRALGFLYPMLADVMLLENIDLNDKLNRRIIVLELVY
ncbi:hypothetical protein ACFSKN_08640 [Mariniflexile gromovii]|uniref:Uncharacterized protein n=1 Tax=Mariniflexile gromovii TaxID=362523 RepID=A0ABS4BZ55_9FLAO|nr:hypothetical protein [Mariniflexile gromovii]MBP0905870.1 hypothetical protein [Mariniflexile gromovii]